MSCIVKLKHGFTKDLQVFSVSQIFCRKKYNKKIKREPLNKKIKWIDKK